MHTQAITNIEIKIARIQEELDSGECPKIYETELREMYYKLCDELRTLQRLQYFSKFK